MSDNDRETQAWQHSQTKYGTFGHTHAQDPVPKEQMAVPPLPKLADSIARLQELRNALDEKKSGYITEIEALTAEVARVREKESSVQEALNQAGLAYQFGKVDLDSPQASTPVT